jgi:hypothetical protein
MMASAHSGHVLTPLAQGAQNACPQLRSVYGIRGKLH